MDDLLLHLARDVGFPAVVAAYVLIRLDRRLARVEETLVRILAATTGADEASRLQPVRTTKEA